jgi:hypothetical protein
MAPLVVPRLPRLTHLLLAALTVAGLAGWTPATAQPGDPSSFSFLRFAPSARAAALTGAFGALPDGGLAGMLHNPAHLGPEAHRGAVLSYLNHLSDINAGTVAYGHDLGAWGTGGVSLRFMSWGRIEGANEVGERTGTFGAGDLALTAGLGRTLGEQGRYGANLHLIHSYLDDVGATAVAIDLGALYHIPAYQLTVSASVNNLGTALDSFGPRRNTLPLDVRLSAAKRLRYLPLTLSITAYDLHDVDEGLTGGTTLDHVLGHLAIGGEIELASSFVVRAGYNHRRSHDLALSDNRFDLAGLGLGFGLNVRDIQLSYAYNSWSSYGGLHWVTVELSV